ncbi:NAD-dependent DNA ligase LigA [Marispirochaeta sp.]|uniref:NAD-dependent DNA ligase LigA n=1 Tax=Marispirochaeta sp. TaxID=2038653 RepID=UPI0029C692ED|nr:NAD-dependent DNA ligase LigA [Marispirochaeta sp.]
MPDPKQEIDSLTEKLQQWQQEYYQKARPSVSDTEYDRVFDMLKELEEKHPGLRRPDSPTLRVGSDLSAELPEVEHTIPVLSLDKAYTAAEVDAWVAKTAKNAEEDLSFVIEEKIDGASIVLYYENGLLVRGVTRGNGHIGNDVTDNIRTIRSVPLRLSEAVSIAVRGEVFLPLDRFDEINADQEVPFANPRNLAAGTLRRKKSSGVALLPLDIFVYEGYMSGSDEEPFEQHHLVLDYLIGLGFKVNPRLGIFGSRCTGPVFRSEAGLEFSSGPLDAVEPFLERMTAGRNNLGYEIDGLVIKVNELESRERLGYTGHHPRWAIAYKFESPQAVSMVESIDVQVGRTGRITPVARIKPVRIGGSTVSNVTLHNQQYIEALELAEGDQVAVSRRGDVIPAVEKVIEKGESSDPVWQMPEICPSCGGTLEVRGAHHFCVNRRCPDQVSGRINFFIARDQMDIDGLGPETAAVLLDQGIIAGIEDIYTFDAERLKGLPGFGEKKIALLQKGIKESRKRPFRIVLPSLGIPDLGQKAAELLIEAGFRDVDSLLEAADKHDTEHLAGIHGIGEKTAASILESLRDPELRRQIDALRKAGLNFREKESGADEQLPPIFEGQVWCVTGSFENFKPRSKAMEEVKKRGGRAVGSVTGTVTHLLAGEGAGSKLEKSRELGIEIVSEEEFLRLLEES